MKRFVVRGGLQMKSGNNTKNGDFFRKNLQECLIEIKKKEISCGDDFFL